MRVSELIEHLETVQEEYGDCTVGATCDGWVPDTISVEVHEEDDHCVLFGRRSVSKYSKSQADVDIINLE